MVDPELPPEGEPEGGDEGVELDPITEAIMRAPSELKALLEDLDEFDVVYVGMIEDLFTFGALTATVYVKGGSTEETMGGFNLPRDLDLIIGLVGRGAKPTTHDKIFSLIILVLDRFRNDEAWTTLNGSVRHARVEGYEIFPFKAGKVYVTQGVMRVKCDVRMRIR